MVSKLRIIWKQIVGRTDERSSRHVDSSDTLPKRIATLERVVGQLLDRTATVEKEQMMVTEGSTSGVITEGGTPLVQRGSEPSNDKLPPPPQASSTRAVRVRFHIIRNARI